MVICMLKDQLSHMSAITLGVLYRLPYQYISANLLYIFEDICGQEVPKILIVLKNYNFPKIIYNILL